MHFLTLFFSFMLKGKKTSRPSSNEKCRNLSMASMGFYLHYSYFFILEHSIACSCAFVFIFTKRKNSIPLFQGMGFAYLFSGIIIWTCLYGRPVHGPKSD